VLFGGLIFALFGGFYYWWPKVFRRMLDDRLGKLNFWLMLIGFNLTFFPMHVLGLEGMPRRIANYSPTADWSSLNLLATIGGFTVGGSGGSWSSGGGGFSGGGGSSGGGGASGSW